MEAEKMYPREHIEDVVDMKDIDRIYFMIKEYSEHQNKELIEENKKLDEERMWLYEENKKYEKRLKSEEELYSKMYEIWSDRNLKHYQIEEKMWSIISERCDIFQTNKPKSFIGKSNF